MYVLRVNCSYVMFEGTCAVQDRMMEGTDVNTLIEENRQLNAQVYYYSCYYCTLI